MDITKQKFANVLRVLAVPTDEVKTFNVFWRSGIQRQGKVVVTVESNMGDDISIAELCAMQHLIEEQEILGRTPPLKGLLFEFGSTPIKKIHNQSSTKKRLYPYAYFLTTRFAGATVQIEKDDSWIAPRAENNISFVTINDPPGQLVAFQHMGKVLISRHVIEQFTQRMNNDEPHIVWKQLSSTIETAILVQLDDRHRAEQNALNNKTDGVRYWDKKSKWCFVLADNMLGQKTIVTAYVRL